MTARVEVPDEVTEALSGERAGARAVHCHRDGFAHPDRMLHDLVDVIAADGQSIRVTPRLRGFMRAISKAVEGGGR